MRGEHPYGGEGRYKRVTKIMTETAIESRVMGVAEFNYDIPEATPFWCQGYLTSTESVPDRK